MTLCNSSFGHPLFPSILSKQVSGQLCSSSRGGHWGARWSVCGAHTVQDMEAHEKLPLPKYVHVSYLTKHMQNNNKAHLTSLSLISTCLQILHQWPLTLTQPILICPCPSLAPQCGLRKIKTRRIASPTHGASIIITVCLAVRASPQGDTTGRWRWGIRQHGGWEWHKMMFQEVRRLLRAPPAASGPWPWRADLSLPAPTRSPPRSTYLSVLPASVCS